MFYKILDNQLIYGPCVLSESYELYSDFHTDYSYPIDGWHWFESLEEAELYFGITHA